MFTHYRTQGFILGKEEREEADCFFFIFTQDFGLLKILAKGVRKIASKLRGGLRLFSLAEIEFIQGKAHKTLTDAICLYDFKGIKKDLKKIKIAFSISEIFLKIVPQETADLSLWNLLKVTFKKLNDPSSNPLFVYYYYVWNLFSLIGYQPELYHCVVCLKKVEAKEIYFSAIEGGLVCQKCAQGAVLPLKVKADTIKILRILLQKNPKAASRLKIENHYFQELALLSKNYFANLVSFNEK